MSRLLLLALACLGLLGEDRGARTIPIDVPQDALDRREGGFEAALADARASGRFLLLELGTSWCTWCRRFESETLGHPLARRALENGIVVVLDAESDEGRPVARRFGVAAYPTLIVLDAQGEAQDRIGGFLDPQSLARALERVRRGEGTVGGFRSRLERAPDDLDARLGLSEKLRLLGDSPGARAELVEIGRRDPEGRTLAGELARLELAKEEVLAAWQRTQAIDLGSLERFLVEARHPRARSEAHAYVARTRANEARQLAGRVGAARSEALRRMAREAWLAAFDEAPAPSQAELALELAALFVAHGAEAGAEALERAEAAVRTTLERVEPSRRAEAHELRSRLLEALGRRAEALEAARRALELEPTGARWRRRVTELGG